MSDSTAASHNFHIDTMTLTSMDFARNLKQRLALCLDSSRTYRIQNSVNKIQNAHPLSSFYINTKREDSTDDITDLNSDIHVL